MVSRTFSISLLPTKNTTTVVNINCSFHLLSIYWHLIWINVHNIPMKSVWWPCSIHRGERWDLERLSDLTKVTQREVWQTWDFNLGFSDSKAMHIFFFKWIFYGSAQIIEWTYPCNHQTDQEMEHYQHLRRPSCPLSSSKVATICTIIIMDHCLPILELYFSGIRESRSGVCLRL